jgi:hypothetical protein
MQVNKQTIHGCRHRIIGKNIFVHQLTGTAPGGRYVDKNILILRGGFALYRIPIVAMYKPHSLGGKKVYAAKKIYTA